MCGIFAVLSGPNQVEDSSLLDGLRYLRHRGPDSSGIYVKREVGVHLGHSLLSITSSALNGKQPLVSSSERYVIVFNGEIYNHKDLLAEKYSTLLKSERSDVSIFLESIETDGLINALVSAKGAYAFCLFDSLLNEVTLCRDPVGEKPLYYYEGFKKIVIASEISPIVSTVGFDGDSLRRRARESYMQYGFNIGTSTLVEGVNRLLPGHTLKFRWCADTWQRDSNGQIEFDSTVPHRNSVFRFQNRSKDDTSDRLIRLSEILDQSVVQMLDHPCRSGIFLSGGIDSTSVACSIPKNRRIDIVAYTCKFDDSRYDEAEVAVANAKILGMPCVAEKIGDADALEYITRHKYIFDEPSSDYSFLPLLILSERAARSVRVILTGDGGDELFGGYNRYLFTERYGELLLRTPLKIRKLISVAIAMKDFGILSVLNSVMGFLKNDISFRHLKDRFFKLRGILTAECNLSLYESFLRLDDTGTLKFRDIISSDLKLSDSEVLDLESALPATVVKLLDFYCNLPDDLLIKTDRATMRSSIEARAPLLHHDVVRFVLTAPWPADAARRGRKFPLLRHIRHHQPDLYIPTKKQGFTPPLGAWMRGSLRKWCDEHVSIACDLISSQASESLRRRWKTHLNGDEDCTKLIWSHVSYANWFMKTLEQGSNNSTLLSCNKV